MLYCSGLELVLGLPETLGEVSQWAGGHLPVVVEGCLQECISSQFYHLSKAEEHM